MFLVLVIWLMLYELFFGIYYICIKVFEEKNKIIIFVVQNLVQYGNKWISYYDNYYNVF